MGLPDSRGVPRDPRYLGTYQRSLRLFRLRGYHLLWPRLSSGVRLESRLVTSSGPRMAPQYAPQPHVHNGCSLDMHTVWALPLSLAATDGVAICFLFLRLLRCFNSPGWPRLPMYSAADRQGLPGGVSPFGDPRICLLAATRGLSQLRHVLHRLSVPRHPPHALSSLHAVS